MAQIFPTKANLMATQKSLSLAKLGYELMDRKRNILVREMMQLVDEAKEVESTINEAYKKAYASLQKANDDYWKNLTPQEKAEWDQWSAGESRANDPYQNGYYNSVSSSVPAAQQ